jgi:hypothetical protein
MSEHLEIMDGNEQVGQIDIQYLPLNTAFLHNALIFPEHQNKGYMKNALNTMIIPKLKALGVTRITLIARENDPQKVWSKLGFTFVLSNTKCLMEKHL